jgi:hexosaminidase
MRELGIASVEGIQPWLTRRLGLFLESRGRRLVGWDEILEGAELPANAVVMSWRGVEGALAASRKGHDAVVAAHPTLYFDNRQSAGIDEPPGRLRVVSLEDVYRFEPMPSQLPAEQQRHILGLQANVWTEHIRTEARVGWMTFPRAAAVAELGWSQPEKRDWADFRRRLAAMPERYDALGMPYAKSAFESTATPAATLTKKSGELELCSENIALALEDDAPLEGPRATFAVDIMNPCWLWRGAPTGAAHAIEARVGQVPFNFQIGEDVHKIVFAKPLTPEGELEVHADACDGPLLARLPVAPAVANPATTTLPAVPIPATQGPRDLCLRFAQPRLEPLWVLDSVRLLP